MDNQSPDLTYAHRAKPYSSELELHLGARELVAEKGKSRQVYPLGKIERIRLSFSPRNTSKLTFVCELRATDGSSVRFDNLTWKSLIETERLDKPFRRIVEALVARVHDANPAVRLEAGIAPMKFQIMRVIGIGLVAALVASAGIAGWRGSLVVALGSLGLAVYIALWLRDFLTRNRPRGFTAATIPENVLPAG